MMSESSETTVNAPDIDQEVVEDLERLEYYSHNDYVEVKINGVEKSGEDHVLVSFNPPAGSPFQEKMRVPVDPEHDTPFTRLLETTGYDYSTVKETVGERVPFRYTDDGWELVHQPQHDSVRDKTKYILATHSPLSLGMVSKALLFNLLSFSALFGVFYILTLTDTDEQGLVLPELHSVPAVELFGFMLCITLPMVIGAILATAAGFRDWSL